MKYNTKSRRWPKWRPQANRPKFSFGWVCAGSFDDRSKKITVAFVKILNKIGIDFAVLGTEESCTGDPGPAGGQRVFVPDAGQWPISQVLDMYNVRKIVTACPHCFNTLKNEYPELGGNYEVIHHSVFLQQLIDEGRVKVQGGDNFKGRKNHFPRFVLPVAAPMVFMKPRAPCWRPSTPTWWR